MSLDEIRTKAARHNAAVEELEEAGFVYCAGYVFTGDSFNRKTCTWQPNSQRIGELVWDGDGWVLRAYAGFAHLLEGVCGFTQREAGGSCEP